MYFFEFCIFELQLFTAKVERGSSVKFTWVIDDLEKFGHEGESYSVVFKNPSEYRLKVTQGFLICQIIFF